MNGALVVDKPCGPTSHDVVARVRRALRVAKIGHTVTLDPIATGVLPLVIGRATRLAQFLTADEKEYLAGVRFGYATPTYDAEHRLIRTPDGAPPLLTPPASTVAVPERDLLEALPEFTGTYWQTPPPFSAKKIAGTPAYRLARRQQEVEVRPVQVTVRKLELVACEGGLATIRVVCSSGFYVRSLAHELGQRLGCGAHLEALRRTRSGEFSLNQAVGLGVVEADGPEVLPHLIPMAALLPGLPVVVVNERGARRTAHGNLLTDQDLRDAHSAPAPPESGPVRVIDAEGRLLAIGESTVDRLLQPVVVLV